MTIQTTSVKILRGYWPSAGVQLLPGAQVELAADQAQELAEKGIVEIRAHTSPQQDCDELIDLVRERARRTRDPVRSAYELDFNRYVEWCRGHGELALPLKVESLVRFSVHRLKNVKLETVYRNILGVTTIAALAAGAGNTGGGREAAAARYELNAVLRNAGQRMLDDGYKSARPITPEQAAPVAFELVEEEAAARLGKKLNGYAKSR